MLSQKPNHTKVLLASMNCQGFQQHLGISVGRWRSRLTLSDFCRVQLGPQMRFSPTSPVWGGSVQLGHFPSIDPLSQETRSGTAQCSVDFPTPELLLWQAVPQCLPHCPPRRPCLLLWPCSRQGSTAAFCLGTSICLCLFCRQYIYRAQMRLTHYLFKEKVRSLHKRMFCVDSEGEGQFMTVSVFVIM